MHQAAFLDCLTFDFLSASGDGFDTTEVDVADVRLPMPSWYRFENWELLHLGICHLRFKGLPYSAGPKPR